MSIKEITLELNKLKQLIKEKAPLGRVSFQCATVRALARRSNLDSLETKAKDMWNEYKKAI